METQSPPREAAPVRRTHVTPLAFTRRIAYRSAVAVGHHRVGWALGVVAVAAMLFLTTHQTNGVEVAGAQGAGPGGGDCADITVAYLTQNTVSAAEAAYPCLGGPLAAGVTEQDLVQQAQ